MKKTIEVVAAVIKKEDEFFCVRRGKGRPLENKWEFPGGKLEANESHSEALIREIREELNSTIAVNKFITTVYHEYETFNIILHT